MPLAPAINVEHPIAGGLDFEVLLPTESPIAKTIKFAIDHLSGFSLSGF